VANFNYSLVKTNKFQYDFLLEKNNWLLAQSSSHAQNGHGWRRQGPPLLSTPSNIWYCHARQPPWPGWADLIFCVRNSNQSRGWDWRKKYRVPRVWPWTFNKSRRGMYTGFIGSGKVLFWIFVLLIRWIVEKRSCLYSERQLTILLVYWKWTCDALNSLPFDQLNVSIWKWTSVFCIQQLDQGKSLGPGIQSCCCGQ